MEKLIFNPISGKFDSVDIQTEFYVDLASFPVTGKVNQLYVAKDTGIIYYWNGTSYKLTNENNIIFLDETSTIADFVTGKTHYYIGETGITYDYDTILYPLPVPITNFNFVNLSVFDVFFISDGGNYQFLLKSGQALRDITIIDTNNGFWEIYATEYIDSLYNLQEVTNKGSDTTNAIIVRNNPDTYRTRYSTIGQQLQRNDLGFELRYVDTGIILNRSSGSKTWTLNIPDITANANSSAFTVDFRPNVSGTIALLSDIPTALTNEQIQDAAFTILTDTPTINLTYDDVLNTVTAEVIDNSITNVKLAKLPSLTAIANEFETIEDAQYVPLKPCMKGTTFLQAGSRTITDTRITTTSTVLYSPTNNGILTSIPIRVTKNNGNVVFNTGQITDTCEFDYEITF